MKTYFKKGSWNVICDVCGFKYKAEDIRKRWDGLYVCKEDFELRHPQDFVKGIEDKQNVPFSNGPDEDTIFTQICTLQTSTAFAGVGAAGCMKAGNKNPTYQSILYDYEPPQGTFNNGL